MARVPLFLLFASSPTLALLASLAPAQPGQLNFLHPGISATTIPLPGGQFYGGAMGPVAGRPNEVVVALVDASFIPGVALVNVEAATVQEIYTFTGPFSPYSPAGLAMPSSRHLVLIDSLTSESIVVGTDANEDGIFQSSEFAPLALANITGGAPDSFFGLDPFTGTRSRFVPSWWTGGLPSGAFVYQTADGVNGGQGTGDIVAIDGIASVSPAYLPAGQLWWTGLGLEYDGGIGFGPQGSLFVGSVLQSAGFAGAVFVARDGNTDGQIGAGEVATLLGPTALPGGIYDVASNQDGAVVICSGSEILWAQADTTDPVANGLTSAPVVIASMPPSHFLGGGLMLDSSRPFAPGNPAANATAYVFGPYFNGSALAGTELYVLRPQAAAGIYNWAAYE